MLASSSEGLRSAAGRNSGIGSAPLTWPLAVCASRPGGAGSLSRKSGPLVNLLDVGQAAVESAAESQLSEMT